MRRKAGGDGHEGVSRTMFGNAATARVSGRSPCRHAPRNAPKPQALALRALAAQCETPPPIHFAALQATGGGRSRVQSLQTFEPPSPETRAREKPANRTVPPPARQTFALPPVLALSRRVPCPPSAGTASTSAGCSTGAAPQLAAAAPGRACVRRLSMAAARSPANPAPTMNPGRRPRCLRASGRPRPSSRTSSAETPGTATDSPIARCAAAVRARPVRQGVKQPATRATGSASRFELPAPRHPVGGPAGP